MKLTVRVDGSLRIGMGHLMRMLALAERLRARGATITFVMRDEPVVVERVRRAGFRLCVLPAGDLDMDRFPWLGVPVERDAAETRDAVGADAIDWLIVDNYGIAAAWERALRPHARAILAFDDLADRVHDVDVLVDQNTASADRYLRLVPPHARVFAGPAYAQLRTQFAAARGRTRFRDGRITRVLVTFGSDVGGHTKLAVDALAAAIPDAVATIVLPSAQPALAAVAAAHGWTVVPYIEAMADALAACDLAIGAGGTSSWERAYLGVPSVAWAMVPNQEPVIATLVRAGAIATVPTLPPSLAGVTATLAGLVADPARVRALGLAARAVMRDHERATAELDETIMGRAG